MENPGSTLESESIEEAAVDYSLAMDGTVRAKSAGRITYRSLPRSAFPLTCKSVDLALVCRPLVSCKSCR